MKNVFFSCSKIPFESGVFVWRGGERCVVRLESVEIHLERVRRKLTGHLGSWTSVKSAVWMRGDCRAQDRQGHVEKCAT